MESKTKHRILGVVVVAGLAILAYPFFQGSGKVPGEQALVKAPTFPDQAVQVASSEELAAAQPQEVVPPAIAESAPAASPAQPAPDTTTNIAPQASDAGNQANSNIVNIASPDVAPTADAAKTAPLQDNSKAQPQTAETPVTIENNATPAAPASDADKDKLKTSPSAGTIDNNTVEPGKVQMTEDTRSTEEVATFKAPHHKKLAKAHTKDQPLILSKLTTASAIKANRHQPLDNNGLLQLKKSAWVIQLGSFKEKSNALRMVNKLRASGYRAFIQHVSGNGGQSTRVFVGPEQQQASARIVASELETNLKLHGIVISYKPFSL